MRARYVLTKAHLLLAAALMLLVGGTQRVVAQDNPPQQAHTDAVVAALVDATKTPDATVRKEALSLLGQFLEGRPNVMAAFVDAAKDEQSSVRQVALRRLVKIEDPSPELLAIIVKQGVEFGDLGSQRIRLGVARYAGGISRFGERAIPHLIEVLESDADRDAKIGACEVLSAMQKEGASGIPALLTVVGDNREASAIRVAAAEAATRIAKSADTPPREAPREPAWERALAYAKAFVLHNDANEDGKLSKTEWPRTKLVDLVAADANGDEVLTAEEIAEEITRPKLNAENTN